MMNAGTNTASMLATRARAPIAPEAVQRSDDADRRCKDGRCLQNRGEKSRAALRSRDRDRNRGNGEQLRLAWRERRHPGRDSKQHERDRRGHFNADRRGLPIENRTRRPHQRAKRDHVDDKKTQNDVAGDRIRNRSSQRKRRHQLVAGGARTQIALDGHLPVYGSVRSKPVVNGDSPPNQHEQDIDGTRRERQHRIGGAHQSVPHIVNAIAISVG